MLNFIKCSHVISDLCFTKCNPAQKEMPCAQVGGEPQPNPKCPAAFLQTEKELCYPLHGLGLGRSLSIAGSPSTIKTHCF